MAWDIHVRRAGRHDGNLTHVQARWTSLASIEDVWVQCGPGVRQIGTAEYRREMNAFSRPIGADFAWTDAEPAPVVVLTWTEGGEESQATVPLTESAGALPSGLRRLLHTHTRVEVHPEGRLAAPG